MGLSPDKETISLGNISGDPLNLYNKDNVSKGYLKIDGTVEADTTYRVSEYISIVGGRTYYVAAGKLSGRGVSRSSSSYYTIYGLWYDTEKNVIGRIMSANNIETNENDTICTDTVKEFTAPANASYLRVVATYIGYSTLVLRGHTYYSNSLTLSTVIQGSNSIETWIDDSGEKRVCCALILWYHDKFIHFYFDKETNTSYAPYIKEETNNDTVVLELPIDSDENIISGEYINISATCIWKETKSLYDFIRTGRSFSWKIRLYGKGSVIDKENNTYFPTLNVGYGTISAVNAVKYSIENTTGGNTTVGYRFTTFPHIGLYDNVLDFDVFNSYDKADLLSLLKDKNEESMSDYPNIVSTYYDIIKNYDSRIRYWLMSNGYRLEIDKYRLYPFTYMNSYNNNSEPKISLSYDECFDGYGNPLSGYAVITTNELTNAIGSSVNDDDAAEFEGETYSIYTNYIDSKWGYFEIYNDPEIMIVDNIGETLEDCTEYKLTYSSLELSISFLQSQGIEANYFSYKIYAYNETIDDYEQEYYSGNIYSQKLNISYNRFFNNKKYMLSLSIVDINQRAYMRTIFFDTEFQTTSNTSDVDIVYYKPHNSIIIDWDELNSNAPDNLVGYRVYKTLGESQNLIEIANTLSTDSCVLEDFIVGDNVKIIYYIYPIVTTTINGIEVETVSSPVVTEPVVLGKGVDKVVGLKEISDNVYEIEYDEVWRLWVNLKDEGYTLNTDKNFYNTLATYNQETSGNRKYITKSISALLGHIDCSFGGEYVDTYDMLTSWNDFVSSANMKCLIDARGLILPGNFESNPTVGYLNTKGNPATVKFNWRQKSDLNIIKIYGRLLPFNPTKGGLFLQSSEGLYLSSDEDNDEHLILYGE